MIRHLHAAYLQWQVDMDEKELRDRTIDGSASDKWAAALRQRLNAQIDKIAALRAPRIRYSLRGAR